MTRLAFALVCLLLPSVAATQQPTTPHDTVQGAVRSVDPRKRTVEVTTGVGMSLWVVRLQVPPELRVTSAGAPLPLAELQPGDIVRVSYGSRPAGFVAYTIERVGRLAGPGRSP